MVKRFVLLILHLPALLLAADFTASVNRNQIKSHESLTLNLTLNGTSANAAPDLSPLKNTFHLNGQQQYSNTTITNGRLSSSMTWKISLTPKVEGEISIPSLNISTSEGILSSQPIKVYATKGKLDSNDASDEQGMTLNTEASLTKPYKDEPLFYTLRLTSKSDLANVSLEKFNVENAIVEANGDPKSFKKIIDGVQFNVVEFSFIITPLKAGSLTIPSLTLHGSLPMKRSGHRGSFFDDDFDAMFMMPGFERLKPFTLASNPTVLEVQAPISELSPWLPAKSLHIEEVWDDSQTLQVGEPLTREYKITAEGLTSSQLPNLHPQHSSVQGFKIYADKPESGDEVKEGRIHSYRKERYTLIPQEAGEMTLPEISVAWWDVNNHKKATAHLPARAVRIQPNLNTAFNANVLTQPSDLPATSSQDSATSTGMLIYALLAGLTALLLAAIFWVMALQKKIQKLTEAPTSLKEPSKKTAHPPLIKNSPQEGISKQKKDKREKLPDLNPT